MSGVFAAALRAGPLVLDAAIGTRLIAQGLDLRDDDPAFWNLTHPEEVARCHELDRHAGADIVLTNTFGANRVWLGRWNRAAEFAEINRAAVTLARSSGAMVLGSIGPTAWNSSDPSALLAQAEVLLEAGVDGLILETFTGVNAIEAVASLRSITSGPIIASVFDPGDYGAQLADAGADVVGVNCAHPVDAARMLMELDAQLPLLWKPSAALPERYALTPSEFAAPVSDLIRHGVRLLGGCCGATSDHIAAIRRLIPVVEAR